MLQVVEDGYEFFDKRQLITIFMASNNYKREFDNAASMMIDTLVCYFQILKPLDKMPHKFDFGCTTTV